MSEEATPGKASDHAPTADRVRDLVLKRTGLKRDELKCPREKSLMTPCVARDGGLAVTTDGVCVGCEVPAAELLAKEEEILQRMAKETQVLDARSAEVRLRLFDTRRVALPIPDEILRERGQVYVGASVQCQPWPCHPDHGVRTILDFAIVDVWQTAVDAYDVVVEPWEQRRQPQALLRFVVGSRFNAPGNFAVFHGDRNVTELFDIKKLSLELDADAPPGERRGRTVVKLELFADVEVLAEVELAKEGGLPQAMRGFIEDIASVKEFSEFMRSGKISVESWGSMADRAARILEPQPIALCARCHLPENVHGHDEAGPESHAFVSDAGPPYPGLELLKPEEQEIGCTAPGCGLRPWEHAGADHQFQFRKRMRCVFEADSFFGLGQGDFYEEEVAPGKEIEIGACGRFWVKSVVPLGEETLRVVVESVPTGRMLSDPHPECEHQWSGLGMTTICLPPISHWCCFKCRTFKLHTSALPDIPARTWYAYTWTEGPWDWESEARKAGVELGPRPKAFIDAKDAAVSSETNK